MTETATPAPRITAIHLRQALATRDGIVVQDLTDGQVFALPRGLSKLEAMDETLVVVVTNREAADYLTGADGNHAKAARSASTLLAWEYDAIDARLAEWAAKADAS